MRPVQREEIVDWATYDETRAETRDKLLAIKAPRRIRLLDVLTFLFENRETVRYQIQEMMRAEQIVKEAEIRHEIATYNELLGGSGELGATLLIELDDPAARQEKLVAWKNLPDRLYLRLEDGRQIRPSYDPRQMGEERLSSVQYLKFDTGGETPIAIGVDHPQLSGEERLTEVQRAALRADLAEP